MLQKYAKPTGWKYIKSGAKILLYVETVLFVSSYGVWYCLNTRRDFRRFMHINCPSILEGYYKVGEYLSGNNNIRTLDYSMWEQERRTST